MSWLSHRNNLYVVAIVTLAFLFGIIDSVFNVGIESKIVGIKVVLLLAIGQMYIIFALWKRYI